MVTRTLLSWWRSERLRKFLVGLIIAIVVFSLPTIVYLLVDQNRTAAQQQAQTLALLNELKDKDHQLSASLTERANTLAQIKVLAQTVDQLATEDNAVIVRLPADTAFVGQLIVSLAHQTQALCNAVHATCSSLPPLPAPLPTTSHTTTSTTVPQHATTSTTVPRHPHGKGKR